MKVLAKSGLLAIALSGILLPCLSPAQTVAPAALPAKVSDADKTDASTTRDSQQPDANRGDGVAPPAAPTATPPDVDWSQRAARLIQQLGDPLFSNREAASDQLVQMDGRIRSALAAAIHSKDAEVRARAKRIDSVISERDFQRRLQAFAGDLEGKENLDLPGWSRFRKLVGEDKAARELFVDMQRAEPKLMESSVGAPAAAAEVLSDRIRDSFMLMNFGGVQSRVNRPVGGPLAIMFVASDPQIPLSGDAAQQMTSLTYQPAMQANLTGPRAPLVRRVLAAWISRDTDDVNVMAQNLAAAANYNLPEGLALAKNLLTKPGTQPYVKYQGISYLIKANDKQQAELLRPLLGDNGLIANFNPNQQEKDSVRVCDLALFGMVHLLGQKPNDFGMPRVKLQNGQHVDLQSLAFKTEDDRKAALKKWDDWLKEHREPAGAKEKSDPAAKPSDRPAESPTPATPGDAPRPKKTTVPPAADRPRDLKSEVDDAAPDADAHE